jgi:hypothetical protein
MVTQMQDVIAKYEERVGSLENVTRCSYDRRMLRSDGSPNRSFFCSPVIMFILEFSASILYIPRSPVIMFRLEFQACFFYLPRSPVIMFRLEF